ncbi:MAG: BlaI/MecI/CopY family transcriptional regulator [Bryobacterales bacterium]|nr:BlaI/MecI/CopY family transcriptional regulator [Bryobacterales bacterium]
MRTARPPKEIPPPLELECLKALWDIGEGNVRSVQLQMEPRKRLAYTTVMTLLERLAKKGGVARRKVGRAFLYTPTVGREEMRRKAVLELADSLFDGSTDLLRSYAAHQPVAPAVAAEEATDGRLDASLL